MATSKLATASGPAVRQGVRPRPGTRRLRRAGWTCLAGAGLVVLFWTLYLSGALAPTDEEAVVRAFESAFPLADAVLAATLVGAGTGLLRGRPHGAFLLTVAGAMCLYLGLLDATFYGLRALEGGDAAAGVATLVIPGLCLGGGAWALVRGHALWRAR